MTCLIRDDKFSSICSLDSFVPYVKYMSRKMLFFLSLISVLTELIDAVPMLGGGDERPCKTIKAAGLDSLDGTCETYSDCQKFISLPEQTSSSPHCGTCLFDLWIST